MTTLVAFAMLAYLITSYIIPRVGPQFTRIGLSGKDLLKVAPKEGQLKPLPESMGFVAAITYFFIMVFLVPFVFFKYLIVANTSNDIITTAYAQQYLLVENNQMFPHNQLATYLSMLLCLLATTLLGFCDDLFDIRWRHKFFLPAIAAIPLLIVYYVDFSVTSVVVPKFINDNAAGEMFLHVLNLVVWVGNQLVTKMTGLLFQSLPWNYDILPGNPKLLDLGVFYYVYMAAIAIFTPNSINILAGINGLEVGQLIVLGLVLLINDLFYLTADHVPEKTYELHILLVLFLVPFLGVSFAVLRYNWFPARVFVGDTYCYFAGMVFAVVAILAHYSKTLLMFLLPQIINFIYSVPQLFHIVPCPRHRMPKLDPTSGNLHASYGELYSLEGIDGDKGERASLRKTEIMVKYMLTPMEKLRLINLKRDQKNKVVAFSNMTMINWLLVTFGPMREDRLCLLILTIQLATGLLMISFRHSLGPWIFGYVDDLAWGEI